MKNAIVFAFFAAAMGSSAVAQDCAEGQRLFVHDHGQTCIPETPERIVSLRGEQFTAPLWELGANLVGSSGRVDGSKNDGLPYPRGAYDIFGLTFSDSDLTWVGDPNNPDLEAIAGADPDLILIPDWQTDIYDQLSIIAPTVVIGIWSNPLLQRFEKIADAGGVLEEYEDRLSQFNTQLADGRRVVEDMIGDSSEVSVAVAEAFDGKLWVYKDYAALSHVIDELGFVTPPVIAQLKDGNAELSPEILPQIDSDFMVGTYNIAFDQPPSTRLAEWDDLVPGWDEILHAPRHNQHLLLDRETMRGVSFRALENTLAIVLANIATRDFVPLNN
ncbi:iron complex transport system substrate-binding protein [Roseivivax halotolerans]|uniref:Iron complex transport system substrate-binding protein n=1 Tax=Roseivivax halotolerans TaxID=93684 RepID=A0A1I6A6E1_9RHOB|nr:ABC transporter substrate-binding protein [Roseivivax halotolerans]SFQ64279.1 iron complex transport system substrate-binding protein [Roseivivax halotolerans]